MVQREYFIYVLADNICFIFYKCYGYMYNHISYVVLGMTT